MAKRLTEPERIWATYHQALGEAIAAWADLEDILGHLFCHVAGVNRITGLAIFYSGRNFGTRADMLSAAISHPQCADVEMPLIKTGLAVARRYSAFRNAMAHDRHVQFFSGDVYFSKGNDVVGAIREGKAHTLPDIRQATANITQLTDLIRGPDLWVEHEKEWRERHHEQLLRLPILAHSSEPTPTPKPKRLPRRSSKGAL